MTNDKNSVIKYKNVDRANYLAWKRTLCAALSTHPDKLLTVMTDKTLSKSVELKLKDASEEDLKTVLDEADTATWHILIASIEDTTTLNALEREFMKDGEPVKDSSHLAYKSISDRWSLDSKTNAIAMAARADKLNGDRDAYMHAGSKSGSYARTWSSSSSDPVRPKPYGPVTRPTLR